MKRNRPKAGHGAKPPPQTQSSMAQIIAAFVRGTKGEISMISKTRTKAMTLLLSLVMLIGLMPGMNLTAYAAPAETLLTTITGTGSNTNPNYATSANVSYSTEGVATLTFSEPTPNGGVAYNSTPAWGWWGYDITLTVTPAEGYTITKCVFYDNANRTATDSEAPFVVETTELDKTPKVNGTPILADQSKGITKIEVYGYVTPTADTTSTYTLTIPSTLTVANSGWNATDGISATGSLAEGKKLTVTASSDGEFALVNQSDNTQKVGYTLATASTDTEATTVWDFTELSDTPVTKPMGIIVENYDDKPAGTYTDTVTFTAAVESAVPTLATAFENGAVIVINFKYQGSAASATLTNDNGTFKYTAGSGYLWNYQHDLNYPDMVIARNEDSKLVVRAADQFGSGYNGNDKDYDMMLKMVFDPATNIYEQSVSRASWDTYMTDAQRLNEYAFTSITINGTDITSTLTKGSQIVVVN